MKLQLNLTKSDQTFSDIVYYQITTKLQPAHLFSFRPELVESVQSLMTQIRSNKSHFFTYNKVQI